VATDFIDDAVFDRANPLDLDLHDIVGPEPDGRLHHRTDTICNTDQVAPEYVNVTSFIMYAAPHQHPSLTYSSSVNL
jgi:hypothetical protein